MRQTCGEFAERREFLSLLANHRKASDAIGQHAHQALREVRHAMQHFRKVDRVHGQSAHRTNGARRQGHCLHSREGQEAGYGGGLLRVGRTVRFAFSPSAYFAFEEDNHRIRGRTFASYDFAGLYSPLFGVCDKPFEVGA